MSEDLPIEQELLVQAAEGPIKQSVGAVFDSINRSVESLDLFGRYERTQKRSIRTALENIKLLGMSNPIPLAKIYYPTHVSTTIRRRLYELEWLSEKTQPISTPRQKGGRNRNEKDVDAAGFVKNNQKVVVLGGPGAGKTTFLRFLALMHSGWIESTSGHSDAIPFFVHLPHFAKASSELFDFAINPLVKATDQHATDFAKRVFGNGTALLLLDSLDEVPLGLRGDVIGKIKAFEALYPQSRIVVSCRTADYEEVLQNFCEVEVARLSQEAIANIIKAWFDGEHAKAAHLVSLIKDDPGVASLTETPLLLSLLCIQYRHDLQLPKRKTELYRRCLYALLRDWDSERGFRRESAYESMSDDRKERLFEHIAGRFFIDQEAYEFRKDQVTDLVGDFIGKIDIEKCHAPAIIDEIERHHGIIEQLSQDYFCFSHTSMQDYFVARHILSKRVELELITSNIENENWFPVIEFAIALAEDPGPILKLLIKKSEMRGLSNFPPMARRTKLLMLLHRGMLASPFISQELSKECFEHLVTSQIQMAKIFQAGMVIPLAELGGFGVRHMLFYMNRPRPTLGEALGPYRKLSNQILMSPLEGYAQACFKAVDIILGSDPKPGVQNLVNDALLINLLMPLGQAWPNDVIRRLDQIAEKTKTSFVKDVVKQSSSYIRDLGKHR